MLSKKDIEELATGAVKRYFRDSREIGLKL